MQRSRSWLLTRRILIGLACGAVTGVLLKYAAYGMPQGPLEEANEFANVMKLAGIVAVLGGVAGGALSASGWRMFVGAAVGALVFGISGAMGRLHLKGFIYAFLGGPIGALVVFLANSAREEAAGRGPTAAGPVPPKHASGSDRPIPPEPEA